MLYNKRRHRGCRFAMTAPILVAWLNNSTLEPFPIRASSSLKKITDREPGADSGTQKLIFCSRNHSSL